MRPRGVLRVRRPGLGAYWTSGQNWTVRVAGAVALEVRSVCTFSLWSVPATPHGRRGSGRGFDGDEW
jgi:hypothetical protein